MIDLIRPDSEEEARLIVEKYSGGEPEILKNDFFHSLLAAFTAGEVRNHLSEAGLLEQLRVRVVSDRHFAVSGKINPDHAARKFAERHQGHRHT